ncbi:MAG: 30S ribosomal protein S2 [Candidatus Pacebacteria bacterium]|nr:30S ribosomal protein S2 [Candidatus Paceibacterota bacterium]
MTEEKKIKNDDIIEAMFKAGAHFGYQKSRRNASVAPYIYGTKNKTEIIDLEETVKMLEKAKDFVTELAKLGKQILFVGGKNEARNTVKIGAMSVDMPYIDGRWIGGTITNTTEIKKRVAKFEDLQRQKEKGELSKYTKKEKMLIEKEIDNLDIMFSGIVGMKDLPKALFVIDPKKENIAVSEAKKAGIPVIALANTDCNIKEIDYPIVANDASVSSISFFVSEIVKAYKAGKVAKN